MNAQQEMIINQLKEKHGIDFSKDYYQLGMSQVDGLVYWAKAYGYRKPKTASGSTGRYFYSFLVKLIEKDKKNSLTAL